MNGTYFATFQISVQQEKKVLKQSQQDVSTKIFIKKKKKSDKKIISELGFSSKMDPPNFFIHCSEKLPYVLEKNVIFF